MIAAASGARVVAVDVRPEALAMARRCGAAITIDATASIGTASIGTASIGTASTGTASAGTASTGVAEAVREATGGGAHLSLDALGSQDTLTASVEGLRRRGRHVQVGWLPAVAGRPAVPMELVVAHELEVLGSHGMPAHAYPRMLGLVESGVLRPADLVTGELALAAAPEALAAMGGPTPPGIRVIVP
jgi:alcohol dehydrogenase